MASRSSLCARNSSIAERPSNDSMTEHPVLPCTFEAAIPQCLLILHHQGSLRFARRAAVSSRTGWRSSSPTAYVPHRAVKPGRSFRSRSTRHMNCATMVADYPFRHGQSHAAPRELGAKERIEDPGRGGFRLCRYRYPRHPAARSCYSGRVRVLMPCFPRPLRAAW